MKTDGLYLEGNIVTSGKNKYKVEKSESKKNTEDHLAE
jgi:hypothetical protein